MELFDVLSSDIRPAQPVVLASHDEARTVVIELPAGDALRDHEVHERATLVVIDGKIEIETGGETRRASNGFVGIFDPSERHEIRAVSDARLLLVLSPWPGVGHPRRATARLRAVGGP